MVQETPPGSYLGSARERNKDMTQWTSKVRPRPCPVALGCAMSPRSHRIVLTCPFSKMADRQKTQNFDSGQKPAPLHGISLADFGGNLNFGPTLVPASQTPPISSIIQPTATTSSSRGMNQCSVMPHVTFLFSHLGCSHRLSLRSNGMITWVWCYIIEWLRVLTSVIIFQGQKSC